MIISERSQAYSKQNPSDYLLLLAMNTVNTIYLRLRTPSCKNLSVLNIVKQYSSAGNDRVVAPKRIQREPTDILKALASTVQKDPTAPHYKYHDDPYLIPRSNIAKRSFALSKESGRKAAQWITANHSELFQHRIADPPVEAFYPKPVYDENSEVSEDVLKKVIDDVLVLDAITVYQLLQKKGQTVSDSTVQSLLELLCFFNSEDTLPEDMIEERWFRQGFWRKDKRKTWKDNGMAETIFRSLESPNSAAYSTLLQGMTRFYQVDRAWQLYQETQEKQIPLTTEAYNSLISVVCFLREGNELRWQLIQELLTAMEKQGLKPTIGTLNAILETISSMGPQKHVKTYALRMLAELKRAGVQPSLASYYFLLITFCKERGPVNSILVDIMNAIEGQTFKIQDPRDTFFFVTAMDICRNHLQDLELAHRVDKLLHTGDNYDLIGDSFKESIYYRHYFILLCSMEPLEVFWQHYSKLVPNIYIPEPAVMEEVIKIVDLNGAPEYFPKLWSDMVIFDHAERPSNVAAILSGMVKNEPQDSSELTNQFAEIAWDAWNKLEVEVEEDKYRQFSWTGAMLGDLMVLCLRGGNHGRALEILKKLERDENNIMGVPNVEALQLLLDICITQNDTHAAIKCIQYCGDAGYSETGRFAQLLYASLELNEEQKRKLTNIVGEDALQQLVAT